MKKKISKLIVLCLFLFLVTGCSTQLKTTDNKLVKNTTTGQTLTKNILCQPNNEETIKMYTETLEKSKTTLQEKLAKNEITQAEFDKKVSGLMDITKLPKCSEFTMTSGGYEGLWTSLFVKPLAFLIIKIGEFCKNYGLAVIIVTLIIRLLLYPVTLKTAKQSELMKAAKPEIDKIDKKYKGKTDQQSMLAKSQETSQVYKRYNINPLLGCVFAFIQIPLFFAFYEALNRLPAIFEGNFLGLQLGTTAGTAILKGEYYYIILVLLVIAATYFSIKLNKTASIDNEQAKTMGMMMNMMIVMISIASFTVSTGIALYWIINNAFTIAQNLIVKRSEKNV